MAVSDRDEEDVWRLSSDRQAESLLLLHSWKTRKSPHAWWLLRLVFADRMAGQHTRHGHAPSGVSCSPERPPHHTCGRCRNLGSEAGVFRRCNLRCVLTLVRRVAHVWRADTIRDREGKRPSHCVEGLKAPDNGVTTVAQCSHEVRRRHQSVRGESSRAKTQVHTSAHAGQDPRSGHHRHLDHSQV